jgi:hypothetical protein
VQCVTLRSISTSKLSNVSAILEGRRWKQKEKIRTSKGFEHEMSTVRNVVGARTRAQIQMLVHTTQYTVLRRTHHKKVATAQERAPSSIPRKDQCALPSGITTVTMRQLIVHPDLTTFVFLLVNHIGFAMRRTQSMSRHTSGFLLTASSNIGYRHRGLKLGAGATEIRRNTWSTCDGVLPFPPHGPRDC